MDQQFCGDIKDREVKVKFEKETIDVRIFPDDTVAVAEAKIASALKLDHYPVIRCKIKPTDIKNRVLINMFHEKGVNNLLVKDFVESFYNETGKRLKAPFKEDHVIGYDEAKKALKPLDLDFFYEPMSVNRKDIDIRDRTIESFYPFGNTIYAHAGGARERPKTGGVSESDLVALAAFDGKNVGKVVKCQPNYVQYRIRSDAVINLNMFKVFSEINPTPAIPFMKWISNTKTVFKVHKSFAYQKNMISVWTKVDNTRYVKITNEIIVMKVVLDKVIWNKEQMFATVIVFANGMYDIKMNFNIGFVVSAKEIRGYLEAVSKVVHQLFPSFTIVENFGTTDAFKIIASGLIEDNKKQVGHAELQKTIEEKLPSVFSVLQNTGGILQLAYKRGDGFCNEENAKSFMNQHASLSKQELIKKIKDIFSILDSEAERVYKEWKREHSLDKAFVKFRKIKWTIVRLKSSKLSYKFIIDGATNGLQVRRIIHALKYAIRQAQDMKKKAPVSKIALMGADSDSDNDDDSDDAIDLDLSLFGLNEFMGNDSEEIDGGEEGEGEEGEGDVNVNEMKLKMQCPAPLRKGGEDAWLHKYVLNKLYEADKDLFQYPSENGKHYAKTCQKVSMRQPIVTSKQELDYNEKCFPGAITGSVNYGTTEELAQKNHYWCPKVWCPKSRVGLTMEQYEANNKKCPFPGVSETPIVFDHKDYWKGKPRQIGYLSPTEHPSQFCMPCCFVKALTEKNNKCVETVGNDKYIKTEGYPVEEKRYGLLPAVLATFFGNKYCGGKDGGQGVMNEKTDCFLRYGIPLNNQSFFQCIVSSFDNKKLGTPEDLAKAIVTNIDMGLFISCGNGELCKAFLSFAFPPITDLKSWNDFKLFFLSEKNKVYVDQFNLSFVVNILKVTPSYNSAIPYSLYILREYRFYNALEEFKRHVANGHIKKTHENGLMHLVQTQRSWMNSNGYNLIVIEGGGGTDGDQYNIACPYNQRTFNKERPTTILLKQGAYYEPIHYVKYNTVTKDKNKKGVISIDKNHQTDNESIAYLAEIYTKCKGADIEEQIKNYLVKEGDIIAQILNYELQVCGFYCKDNVVVPLKKGVPIDPTLSGVFIDTCISTFSHTLSEKRVLSKLEKINDFLAKSKYYVVTSGDGGAGALRFKDCYAIVPLKKDVQAQEIIRDGEIFVGYEHEDKRSAFMVIKNNTEELYRQFWNEIVILFKRKDIGEEFRNLVDMMRHPMNPLDKDTKRMDIKDYLEGVLSRSIYKGRGLGGGGGGRRICSQIAKKNDCVAPCSFIANIRDGSKKGAHCKLNVPTGEYDFLLERCIEDLLNPIVNLSVRYITKVIDDVIMFTDQEIKREGLQTLLNRDNFGKMDYVANYINIQPVEKVIVTLPGFIKVDDPLPLPTFLKKMLNEFSLHTIENDSLVEFFKIIQNKIHPESPLSKEQIASEIKDVKDATEKLEALARVCQVNCLFVSRQTPANPDRMRCLGRFENLDFYIMINYPKTNGKFQVFLKNKKKYLFTRTDIPESFFVNINNKCRNYRI